MMYPCCWHNVLAQYGQGHWQSHCRMPCVCYVCASESTGTSDFAHTTNQTLGEAWYYLFEFGGKDYIIVVDYYSKFPELEKLTNKTAHGVILALKAVMAWHGTPDELVSDNMPFDSATFRQFAQDWGFVLTTSIPRYPQSNGQSERFVQTIKNYLKKTHSEGKDVYTTLLEYRATPIAGISASPAQLLMSRRLKTKLPTTSNLLKPAVVEDARNRLVSRQQRQKQFYDRGTKFRRKYREGDSVRARLDKTWDKAVISQVHQTPRAYVVTTPEGQSYRRNQRFIRDSPDPFEKSQVLDTSPAAGVAHVSPPVVEQAITPETGGTPGNSLSSHSSVENPPGQGPPVSLETRHSGRQRQPPAWHRDYKMSNE